MRSNIVHIIKSSPARSILVLVVLSLLAGPVCADEVTVMDGSFVRGSVTGISPNDVLSISTNDGKRKIPCDEILTVQLSKTDAPARRGSARIMLRNKDIFVGDITSGTKTSLSLRTFSLGEIELSFDHIRQMEFEHDADETEGRPTNGLGSQLPDASSDRDMVVLLNGDQLPGVLSRVDGNGIRFSCALGDITLGFDKMLGIALAPGPKKNRPDGLLAKVGTAGGSSITGTIEQLDADRLSFRPLVGETKNILRSRVRSIAFSGGRVVFLSDLDPEEVVEEPCVRDPRNPVGDDWWWHYRRDRNVSGGPIRLGGRTWRKGLGVHSRCKLSYRVDKNYSRLLATFGIDDETKGKGHVTFSVLGDGDVIFPEQSAAAEISGEDTPRKIDIDISDVAVVTLVVDFGERLHIFDRADWAAARLIRK